MYVIQVGLKWLVQTQIKNQSSDYWNDLQINYWKLKQIVMQFFALTHLAEISKVYFIFFLMQKNLFTYA